MMWAHVDGHAPRSGISVIARPRVLQWSHEIMLPSDTPVIRVCVNTPYDVLTMTRPTNNMSLLDFV